MPSNGTTNQRGYGADHQRTREQYEPLVQSGRAICPRCGESINPDSPWDLGHSNDRTQHTGPEHTYCNRSAGGRRSKPNRSIRTPEPHPGLTRGSRPPPGLAG